MASSVQSPSLETKKLQVVTQAPNLRQLQNQNQIKNKTAYI
jgi:hypothetical protein